MKTRVLPIRVVIAPLILSLGIIVTSGFMNSQFESSVSSPETIKEVLKPLPTPPKNRNATNQAFDVPEAVLQEVLARIRIFKDLGRLNELLSEADSIETRWGEKGGKNYGLLFRKLLSALTSGNITSKHPNAFDLGQKYAEIALKNADSFDLETEWLLLMNLRLPSRNSELSGAEVDHRRNRVKRWLHLLRRLENEKDENFDDSDLPALNVPLPPGVMGVPGMAPEGVRDVRLREIYRKAIEENAKKIKYFNHQLRLRQNEELIIKDGLRYISEMYAIQPSRGEELEKLLIEYNISRDLKKSIIRAVEKVKSENEIGFDAS